MAKAVQGEVVKKHAGGRPTKATPELITKAWDYIHEKRNMSVNELLPTVEGLALELGVRRETLYAWEKNSDEFSNIVSNMRSAQAEKLIQNALVGRYNPTIAKLLLSKHGYVEKTEVDNKVEMVQPILGGGAKQIDHVYGDDLDS